MDNELMALMQVLSNKPYLTLKDIEVSAGITRRQATYRIEKVNDLLRQHHAPIITIGTAKEIRLIPKHGRSLGAASGDESKQPVLHEQKGTSDLYVSDAVYEQ